MDTPSYELTLAERDNYLVQIEAQIEAKRNLLLGKRKFLENTLKENQFLEGVKNDYHKYYDYIAKQKMDELNNYTDIDWFMNLTNLELIKLIYGIKDLFDYRLELTNTKKRQIIKSGVVFYKDNNYYKYQPFDKLREEIIDEFDKLVSEGETKDERYLGSLIILSGLVERDNNCATAYPWLLQGSFN